MGKVFRNEGIEDLKTRERSGRPPEIEHDVMVGIERKVLQQEQLDDGGSSSGKRITCSLAKP